MREIKLRAYNKNLKCFVYGSSSFTRTSIEDCQYTLSDFWTLIERGAFEYAGQFTGLHDKSGKEIFVGDVLRECFYVSQFIEEPMFDEKREQLPDGRTIITPVMKPLKPFDPDGPIFDGTWVAEERDGEFIVESFEKFYRRIFEIVRSKDRESLLSGAFFEVIGNIYSNPELSGKED